MIDGERSRLCWEPEKKNPGEGRRDRNPEVGTRGGKKKKEYLSCPLHLLQLWEFIFIVLNIYLAALSLRCGTWDLVP